MMTVSPFDDLKTHERRVARLSLDWEKQYMEKSVDLSTSAWYGDRTLRLGFPEDWDIYVVRQNHYPALTHDEIRKKILSPLGTSRLSELARGKNRVAILIDDIHRPTRLHKVFPCVLDELTSGGVQEHQITVVAAVACHRPATEEDFIKKLGTNFGNTIRTVSHDCKSHLVYLGKTARGTPIHVNRYVYESDLKVGISGVYPHEHAGFGGGAKIIHPGICGIETAQYLHHHLTGVSRGGSIHNNFRADIEEIAQRVGLDFTVNVLLNERRDISHIFCGDMILSHNEGVMTSHKVYRVKPVIDADIVVANVYPFDTSLQFVSKGLWPLKYGSKSSSKVVIASCPEGIGYHALSLRSVPGWSGFFRRMRALSFSDIKDFFRRVREREPEFLFFSPTVKKNTLRKMYPTAKLFNTWGTLIQDLKDMHKKLPVKVAIYSCSPLQIPEGEG